MLLSLVWGPGGGCQALCGGVNSVQIGSEKARSEALTLNVAWLKDQMNQQMRQFPKLVVHSGHP